MTTLEAVDKVIQDTYRKIWSVWYNGIDFTQPARVVVTIHVDSDSTYSIKEDIIYIRLLEGNLQDPEILEANDLSVWKINLIHEMLHEYQYKVVKEVSKDALQLYQKYQQDDRTAKFANGIFGYSGPGHDEKFYEAICKWSSYFGFSPEELMRNQI